MRRDWSGWLAVVLVVALVSCSDRSVLGVERIPSPDGGHELVLTRVIHGANDPNPYTTEVALDGREVVKIDWQGEVRVRWLANDRVVIQLEEWLYRQNIPLPTVKVDGVAVEFVEVHRSQPR